MKISIVVPAFNRPDLLIQTLESISKQTIKPFEVIVVDNASTVDMSDITKYCQKQKWKYLKNKKNIGMIGNWNKCIQEAKGEYVCILHSDDLITKNWLKIFKYFILKNKNIDIFICALTLINKYNIPTDAYYPLKKTGKLKNNFKEIWDTNFCSLITSGGMIFKKSVFKKIDYFKKEFKTEADVWFYYQIMKYCKIFYINKILLGYKVHELQAIDKKIQNKSIKVKTENLNNALLVIKTFFIKELNNNNQYRYIYLKQCLFRYMIVIKYFLLNKKEYKIILKNIKQNFPDVFTKKSDYFIFISMIFDYIWRILKGKFIAKKIKNIFT